METCRKQNRIADVIKRGTKNKALAPLRKVIINKLDEKQKTRLYEFRFWGENRSSGLLLSAVAALPLNVVQ